jgi:hypothetical protein
MTHARMNVGNSHHVGQRTVTPVTPMNLNLRILVYSLLAWVAIAVSLQLCRLAIQYADAYE